MERAACLRWHGWLHGAAFPEVAQELLLSGSETSTVVIAFDHLYSSSHFGVLTRSDWLRPSSKHALENIQRCICLLWAICITDCFSILRYLCLHLIQLLLPNLRLLLNLLNDILL